MNAQLGRDIAVAASERLAAEVEHLCAEIARLRSLSVNNAHSWDAIVRERDELRAENARLMARIDQHHKMFEPLRGEIEGLRADLELRNQTALDRKEIIVKLEAEIARRYRDGIERAATEVQVVCDRLDKTLLGEQLAGWLRGLPDDAAAPHPKSPSKA